MKVKLKICTGGCQKPRVIWKRIKGIAWCKDCWFKTGVKQSADQSKENQLKYKTYKPIPHRSPKRIEQEKIYNGKRIIFLSENPMCQAKCVINCQIKSNQIHHKKGRTGDLYIDESHFLAVCGACHSWITDHPAEAIELGLSELRT